MCARTYTLVIKAATALVLSGVSPSAYARGGRTFLDPQLQHRLSRMLGSVAR